MKNSAIEWTHHTFNPWVGCTKVSPACDRCYAETWAKRAGHPELWNGSRRRTKPANWRGPLKWNAAAAARGVRERVFCASLADVFDNEVPQQWRVDLWELIRATPSLDWLLLTKRIGNARRMLPHPFYATDWPNVWIGATVVNPEEIARDVDKLLELHVGIRFLSMEPLLARCDLAYHFGMQWNRTMRCWEGTSSRPFNRRGVDGFSGIDWVIVGGESGGAPRPLEEAWALELREQCAVAGAKFFMKQGSAANWPAFKDFDTFPAALRVREIPEPFKQ